MDIEDLKFWKFDKIPFEGCEIKCPECGEWSKHSHWIESEIDCEDCGTHSAMECPVCHERFDHVWRPTFKVK